MLILDDDFTAEFVIFHYFPRHNFVEESLIFFTSQFCRRVSNSLCMTIDAAYPPTQCAAAKFMRKLFAQSREQKNQILENMGRKTEQGSKSENFAPAVGRIFRRWCCGALPCLSPWLDWWEYCSRMGCRIQVLQSLAAM